MSVLVSLLIRCPTQRPWTWSFRPEFLVQKCHTWPRDACGVCTVIRDWAAQLHQPWENATFSQALREIEPHPTARWGEHSRTQTCTFSTFDQRTKLSLTFQLNSFTGSDDTGQENPSWGPTQNGRWQHHYRRMDIYFTHWVTALTIGSSSGWFLRLFDTLPLLYVFWAVFSFKHYKMLQEIHVYPASVLESNSSPRILCFFYWRTKLETKIWTLGVLFLLGSFSRLTKLYIHIFINISICNHLYLY